MVKKLTGGLAGMAKARKVEVRHRRGQLCRSVSHGGRARGRRQEGREVQQGHHRGRQPGREAAVHARGRSRRRLHRRAAVEEHSGAHARRRRRHHRTRDGKRLLDARCAHRRGRDARRPDARCRPRSGQGVGQDERPPLRQGHAEDQDRGAKASKLGIEVSFEGEQAPKEPQIYDLVLVAVGRSPNGKRIGAEKAGVAVTDRGFIDVDQQMRTNVAHIHAIGDIVGQPMLAHKAVHEAHVAAEAAFGENAALRCATDPIGRLHRPRDRVGRQDRGPSARPKGLNSARRCSRGRRRAARSPTAATKASRS